jgi:hypothetical protein
MSAPMSFPVSEQELDFFEQAAHDAGRKKERLALAKCS